MSMGKDGRSTAGALGISLHRNAHDGAARSRVLVFAPFGHDSHTLCGLLADDGIDCMACDNAHRLLDAIDDQALMVLVTEEGLAQCPTRCFTDRLSNQPIWSDLPILALAGRPGAPSEERRLETLSKLGNVTVIERPVAGESLKMAVKAALRARLLQFQVRDQLNELSDYSRTLELRVDQRTAELARETDERKRIESALSESRRLESLGRLTGGIAHDFNNMLQVVSGGVEMLRLFTRESTDLRIVRALDSISRASVNGATLTRQLLAYARRQPLSNTVVDLRNHLDELTDLLKHSLGSGIRFSVVADDELWTISTDLTQLDSALLNLVLNARDALCGSGEVQLTMHNVTLPDAAFPEVSTLTGQYVAIALADDGPGMSEDVAARAFEPFFTTKPLGNGTGLGLSQVHGFAKQSGGQALIRCRVDGTTVVLLLPSAQIDLEPSVSSERESIRVSGSLAGLHVLCVDDDAAVMEIASDMLANLGAEVTQASSADDAMKLDARQFDLVFSDVMMPGQFDGIGLARHLREKYPDLPVVLASGYVLTPQRLEELDAVFLQKPYSLQQVEVALRRALTNACP